MTETVDQEIERLTADSEARYKGRCASNLYPVKVKCIRTGTWVEPDMPERPSDDSFNFVQEIVAEIEWEWDEDGVTYRHSASKYDGPNYGIPFIEQAPLKPFVGRCRARVRWGMQDAHPENRGFMALPGYDGRTYYGNWSMWSEWHTFTAEEYEVHDEEAEAQRSASGSLQRPIKKTLFRTLQTPNPRRHRMKQKWHQMVQQAEKAQLQAVVDAQIGVRELMGSLGIELEKVTPREQTIEVLRAEVETSSRSFSVDEVAQAFARSPLNRLAFYPMDREYRALPKAVWDRILEYSQVDTLEYVAEIADCDDFAKIFVGQVLREFRMNGVGLVVDLSGKHAYIALLVTDNEGSLEVVSIEPQTDAWGVALEGANPSYKAEMGSVLF